MRANGVRSLMVYCDASHRSAVLDVAAWPDDTPVPAFGPLMMTLQIADRATSCRTAGSCFQVPPPPINSRIRRWFKAISD
jgi:hypothetical protein